MTKTTYYRHPNLKSNYPIINNQYRFKNIRSNDTMDIFKTSSRNECLDYIHNFKKTCEKEYSNQPFVCEIMYKHYVDVCQRRFARADTCSSLNIFGEDTLNFTIKSPSVPR